MTNSLNPFDDERPGETSATARASSGDLAAAEEPFDRRQKPQRRHELSGRAARRHPYSGPLSPMGVPAKLQGSDSGKQGKRRKLLPLVLAIVGGIVIVSCLGLGGVITVNLLSIQSALNSPQATLDTFYSALHTGDYGTAYDQLSSSYQSRLTEESFRATFELIGTIDSYQISNLRTQNNQATAAIKVTLVKQGGGTAVDETKSVQLVLEDGKWKINRVDPSLTRSIWPVGQQALTLDCC
ncbi:MAG TPA: NTF2-like N-terminal transpeptidase domain-containing protein [Ktedonobacterales bacterium]|jgi:hypothetical protein